LVFTFGAAKIIARHEWKLYSENYETSEETIKNFVFAFSWRWRGDHVNHYETLARWTYEFVAAARKEAARGSPRGRKHVATEDDAHTATEEMHDFDVRESWYSDRQLSLLLRPNTLPRGGIKRSILLNPSQSKRIRRPPKPRR